MNIKALSHWNKLLEKCLQTEEKDKKKNYLESCLQKYHHFSPFAIPADGLLGVDEEATFKRMTIRLTTKWKHTYSRTCSYIISRVVINLGRSPHLCIRGYWVPAHKISVK